MQHDDSMDRIISLPPDVLPDMEAVRKRLAAQYRLSAFPGSDGAILEILDLHDHRFLDKGAFSRVYSLDARRVLKFCVDLPSLHILQRLGDHSRFFPRVDRILEAQAYSDDEGEHQVFHVAIVERLQEGYPAWMLGVIDGYRRPFRADTAFFANTRLLTMSSRILSGDIAVPPADVQELAFAMRLLADECLKEDCLADLRTEVNIMLRPNGQAVIADPTYPHRLVC